MVANGMFGLTEMKDQLKCKTAVSMVMAGVGVIELMIINLFYNNAFILIFEYSFT